MEFTTTLEQHGPTATGVEVPEAVVTALGGSRRAAVVATINGYSWRTSLGSRGGQALVGVSAQARAGAAVEAGMTVTVDLTLDTAPRTVEVPADLAEALAAVPGALTRFEALSFSLRRRHVEAVLAAKRPETRAARVATTVAGLTET